MFKFKKGDEVCITYGPAFGSAFGSPSIYMAAMTEGSTITACKETPNGNAYRLKHYAGWWSEENLVPKSNTSKNFSWRDEGSEPITNTQKETKCDTGDSGASEDRARYRELYLKALKKTYGKVPFESETVEVGSLLEFTEAVLKATKEV